MCNFGSCKTRFEFLSQFRKVRNAFQCFVTQVQTRLPKSKCVWPMKINVICTVHFITTQIRPGFYIYTLERSFCLMINIMIDIRHISRCVFRYSIRFILHAPSLDYIFSSVHVKNLPPTAPQEDAWPRSRLERLPLNIHKTVMTTHVVSPFRVAQNAALTPLYGGNSIYTKCHISSFIVRYSHVETYNGVSQGEH